MKIEKQNYKQSYHFTKTRDSQEAFHKPNDFHGYGFEFEMDGQVDNYEEETEALYDGIYRAMKKDKIPYSLQSDCSLRNGVELVSSVIGARKFIDYDFTTLCENAKASGCLFKNPTTTGFHIHISRSIFGRENTKRQRMNIAKLVMFFDIYYYKILKLFGRNVNQSSDYSAMTFRTIDFKNANPMKLLNKYYNYVCDMDDTRPDVYQHDYRRYRAVNLATGINTVEVRIFRGTLDAKIMNGQKNFLIKVINFVRSHGTKSILREGADLCVL